MGLLDLLVRGLLDELKKRMQGCFNGFCYLFLCRCLVGFEFGYGLQGLEFAV